ncbi:hypothetical protein PP410_gp72 [Vibrio phage NF]|uniref:Uncharacterized protein n=1 Tax=Vibrio phage NF TaxID=2686202 RepID=A0A6B9JB62_9CAUD|nr:hypothetical protein PP410_gp72 [Vibrio phage NF]QGZ13289.1 hypothetical protein [Vibrio phage NF]
MKKHKHEKKIKAKLDDMSLVVFEKRKGSGWRELECNDLPVDVGAKYRLCHKNHKTEFLHWLNGGVVEALEDGFWVEKANECYCLNNTVALWGVEEKIRIAENKERRWIAVCNSGYNCIDKLFDNKNQAKEFVTAFYPNNRVGDFQFIEIEIEVEV